MQWKFLLGQMPMTHPEQASLLLLFVPLTKKGLSHSLFYSLPVSNKNRHFLFLSRAAYLLSWLHGFVYDLTAFVILFSSSFSFPPTLQSLQSLIFSIYNIQPTFTFSSDTVEDHFFPLKAACGGQRRGNAVRREEFGKRNGNEKLNWNPSKSLIAHMACKYKRVNGFKTIHVVQITKKHFYSFIPAKRFLFPLLSPAAWQCQIWETFQWNFITLLVR